MLVRASMETPSTSQDITKALVSLLLSALLLGSLAKQDVLPHDDRTLGTQDELSSDNSTLDTLNLVPSDNSTLDSLDVLLLDNSTLATHDALPQHNITFATLEVVSSNSSTLVTKDVISHDTRTLTDMTSIDPASCDHMGSCHTGLVCGCYYYKKGDRLGRFRGGCRKMIDCSQKNLTNNTLLRNIDFSQFDEKFVDIRMEGNKLKVEDIDSLGHHIHQNTETVGTILYFGPLKQLPCTTRIIITRKLSMDTSYTEVRCNNRSLTDKHIENMVLPNSTRRLWLEHNKLTLRARLEAKMNILQHLEQVDLSNNKLTRIPRVNVSQKINFPNNHFSMNLEYNDIKTYDSSTIAQYYATTDDGIYIHLEHNPFICNCEAYYTNEVLVKHGETNQGQFKCLMPDEITGVNKLISLPRKDDEYWKNKCEGWVVDRNGYFYLIFTWQNLLDFCLILANVFVIYIVYDLYMAIRETRLKRVDPKTTNLVRRDSIKSSKSNRKESTSALRKISKFSRKGSQADSVVSKSHSHAPRRPLLDVILCKIKKGYENANNFIHTRVFTKKVQVLVEEEIGSTLDEKEHNLLRDSALECMRNSQNYETKL